MRRSRRDEALEFMQSKRWLCGPSKVSIRNDAMDVESLPPERTKRYGSAIRKAVRALLDDPKESILLLPGTRASEGTYDGMAFSIVNLAERVHRAIYDHAGTEMDEGMDRYVGALWQGIRARPEQRVEMPIPNPPDGTEPDSLMFTAVSSAYPGHHPRHFPMDALALTRMSTIMAVASRQIDRIYAAAGQRAGRQYSTENFIVIPGSPRSET
jgi:hypothetical protein